MTADVFYFFSASSGCSLTMQIASARTLQRGESDPPPPAVPPRVLVQSSLALGVRTPESREIQERMIRPDRLWGWWSIAQ